MYLTTYYFCNKSPIIDVRLGYIQVSENIEIFKVKLSWSKSLRLFTTQRFLVVFEPVNWKLGIRLLETLLSKSFIVPSSWISFCWFSNFTLCKTSFSPSTSSLSLSSWIGPILWVPTFSSMSPQSLEEN